MSRMLDRVGEEQRSPGSWEKRTAGGLRGGIRGRTSTLSGTGREEGDKRRWRSKIETRGAGDQGRDEGEGRVRRMRE